MKNRFYTVSDKCSDAERAFYASKNTLFNNINIYGPLDGESAFKESKGISVINSNFHLRYPLWHVDDLELDCVTFANTSRAPIWYSKDIDARRLSLFSVKAFRECSNIKIEMSGLTSEEVFWRCKNIDLNQCNIDGFYAFFQSENIKMNQCLFKGKYSFQYTKNVEIDDSNLDTKDALWHSKNVTVRGSTLKGEYLGWYSEGLTLINCHIQGTQPLCYCKKLKLINCTFQDADLAFEYSEVEGSIIGNIDSIKNPLKGHLVITTKPEMIVDENDRSEGKFVLSVQVKPYDNDEWKKDLEKQEEINNKK